MMFSEDNNPKRLAQVTLVALLIIGCVAVLLPFVGAVLFAFVIWVCTWPAYADRVLPRLGGRATLGASVMTLALVLVMLLPMIFLVASLASGVDDLFDALKPYFEVGPPPHPPEWLRSLPLVGPELDATWQRVTSSREELNQLAKQLVAPARQLLLFLGGIAGNGVLQISLVLFVVFFLYRDGAALSNALQVAAKKLGDELGSEMLMKARDTVVGVMLGIVGTAAAQAAVATIGLLIAGIPGALLLGFATFFLSTVPIGPPLIWGGAAAWLYGQDESGWAIFMVLYGVFVISSIDNFVKPILMARGAGLSILLVALGVLGGVLVFGFIGIFLGPVLLALGDMLFRHWIREEMAP